MPERTDQNARWSLTGTALDGLLARLDDDRERAALQYEAWRARLQRLLGWWGANHPLELADRTLDRVAFKLEEGAVVPAASLPAYVRSVARLVFYESLRDAEREESARRDEQRTLDTDDDPEEALAALDGCLDSLAAGDRDLILSYYQAGRGSNIAARRGLAARLGLSPTALRIRAHRLRERLETCVGASLERGKR